MYYSLIEPGSIARCMDCVFRYTSVCWAGKFPSMHTSLRAKWTVAISYALAFIISSPLAVLKHISSVQSVPNSLTTYR